MQHVVLATAGHIDHGKTELTRALTGIDTDRLPEEKARGITIDLGFAHLELAGRDVAIIDVPGHERFVKNMLAGVGGIDLALLVIAADESVMPQTREHLAILELLEVPRGVVALTKSDLVDEETLALVRAETADLLGGTRFESAPMVAVSARTGAGMEALRAALSEAVAAAAARDQSGPFREHVDRAFSVKGFGTVVTGTVVSGRVHAGDELELQPLGRRVKVRGIEVHGASSEGAGAGARAALNLAPLELDEAARGQQLLSPGLFQPTSLADVRLRLLPSCPALADRSRLRFHLGAVELLARVKLLGGAGELAPGARGWAQLRFEQPVVLWPGDRFIVRSYSPMTTIGGGLVVDPLPEKHRGSAEQAVRFLEALAAASPRQRLELRIAHAGARGIELGELAAREGRTGAALAADLAALAAAVMRIDSGNPRYFARAAWEALEAEARRLLAAFHAREPLQDGMSREELGGKLFRHDAASARVLLEGLAARGALRLKGDRVAAVGHAIQVSGEEQALMTTVEDAFRRGGLSPEAPAVVLERLGAQRKDAERLLPVLVRGGRLVAVPGGLYFHAEAIAALKTTLASRAAPGQTFSVAEFKDWSGISRKFAIPLLEYLDGSKFTRRVGDKRMLVRS